MKISYFIKREMLMARIRVNGTIKDKSTGIRITGESFDLSQRRFHKKSPNAVQYNKALAQFEASLYDDVEHGRLLSQPPKIEGDVTLQSAMDEYLNLVNCDAVTSRKSNLPLSAATKKNISRVVEIVKRTGIDFNFSRYNASTAHAKPHYEQFVTSLKNAIMQGVDNSSAWSRLCVIKSAIAYVCERHEIELGSLLKGLVIKLVEKDVVVLGHHQVEYVINNYSSIRENCRNRSERVALDYWVTALILNPRRHDMASFEKDNLYYEGGKMWIRYRPNKTKNSSRVTVNVPVPEMLAGIFNRNLLEYGRPLPPCAVNALSGIIKDIAKRIEVFQSDVQVYRRGKYVVMPQWRTLTLHQMRASGMTDKLGGGMPDAVVKAYSGHTIDSRSFRRYVNIHSEAKERFADEYFSKLSGSAVQPQAEAIHN
jgi:hypothetical protein